MLPFLNNHLRTCQYVPYLRSSFIEDAPKNLWNWMNFTEMHTVYIPIESWFTVVYLVHRIHIFLPLCRLRLHSFFIELPLRRVCVCVFILLWRPSDVHMRWFHIWKRFICCSRSAWVLFIDARKWNWNFCSRSHSVCFLLDCKVF